MSRAPESWNLASSRPTLIYFSSFAARRPLPLSTLRSVHGKTPARVTANMFLRSLKIVGSVTLDGSCVTMHLFSTVAPLFGKRSMPRKTNARAPHVRSNLGKTWEISSIRSILSNYIDNRLRRISWKKGFRFEVPEILDSVRKYR